MSGDRGRPHSVLAVRQQIDVDAKMLAKLADYYLMLSKMSSVFRTFMIRQGVPVDDAVSISDSIEYGTRTGMTAIDEAASLLRGTARDMQLINDEVRAALRRARGAEPVSFKLD